MASSSSVARGAAAATDQHIVKIIVASTAGTMIEWYQFYIFGSLASVVASKFFHTGSALGDISAWLAAFAVGFIVRPFGAVVFSRVGNLIGRENTFMVTMSLMGICTFLVGLLPTVETLGASAGLILIGLRIVQGLALGGEYSGAVTFIAEHAPQNRRGLYTSAIQTTATVGFFLSLAVILITRLALGDLAFAAWGWRVPFLLAALLIVISLVIRSSVKDSPFFLRLKSIDQTAKNPVRESLTNPLNLRFVLLAIFGATMGQGVIWYTSQFYALYYLQHVLQVPLVESTLIMGGAVLLSTPLFILTAWISDQIGRKWMILGGIGLAALSYYSIYTAMAGYGPFLANPTDQLPNPAYSPLMLGVLVFVQMVFVTMAYGPIAAFLVEMFPSRIRYSSMALPYHLGNGVFGGLVPLIGMYVLQASGDSLAGLFYPITVAVICVIVGAIFLRDTQHVDITTKAW
ncbi:MAG: MHS family MFS transporter [Oscillochloris sp.]|nr:MHS family MFS transporter [Oscillochloris sp.]